MGGCFHRVYINFLPAGAAGAGSHRWESSLYSLGHRSEIRLILPIACDVSVYNSQVRGFALDEECP